MQSYQTYIIHRNIFTDALATSGKRYRIKQNIKKVLEHQLVHAFVEENDCDEISPIASLEELAKHYESRLISKQPIKNNSKTAKPKENENDGIMRKTSQAHKAAAEAAIKRNCAINEDSSNTFQPDSEFITDLSEMVIDASFNQPVAESTVYTESTCETSVVLKPGEYEIILLVDAMEVTGGSCGGKKSRKALTVEQLESLHVPFETRKLSIGDFVWIARHKRFWDQLNDDYLSEQSGGKKLTAKKNREIKDAAMSKELVLPYIVERKRTDDLRASIMDGRYKEQKQRLSKCGLSKKVYLVEELGGKFETSKYGNYSKQQEGQPFHRGIDRDVLEQAISNTALNDGFSIKRTKTQGESMKYLAKFTNALIKKYTNSTTTLRSCLINSSAWNHSDSLDNFDRSIRSIEYLPTFVEFNDFSRPDKPISVREIFCNMLLTVKGLSPGMAWAITEKYPTPYLLKKAYEDIPRGSQIEKEKAIEKILVGLLYDNPCPKKLPPGISKIIGHLFTDLSLN